MHTLFKSLIAQTLLCIPLLACASSTRLDTLLAAEQAPAGVVIEIVTGERAGLSWALPQAQLYIKKLRQRFPSIHIAIVTHGQEQFALQKKQHTKEKKVHSLTRSLLKDDVQLHVCGTYAEWEGLSKEDFPEYVDVAAAGPTQVNDYLALDYKLIIIKRRENK